ncbi:TetR/AcrR family transcriptional regulator [Thermoleptolyngbya oregonensis]|nr:TetR/AcrR family transcriptional regulator [Thermoleptolyngbya oregonensis]
MTALPSDVPLPDISSGTMRRQPKQARSQERVSQILNAAEALFIEQGYEQTTTRAIATRAQVPVGSLYQFFPDKAAILKALADRYMQQEYELFASLHAAVPEPMPLADYVDRVVEAFDHFMTHQPGYRAVFEQVLGLMTAGAIAEMDTYEARIVDDLADFLGRLRPGLDAAQQRAIALVVVESVGNLLWLSLKADAPLRTRLIAETKRLMTHYLASYFGETIGEAG